MVASEPRRSSRVVRAEALVRLLYTMAQANPGGSPGGRLSSATAREHYSIEREIGRGSYGRVYRATRLADGLAVAIKVIPTDDDEEVASLAEQVSREVETLRRCESAHVLQYLASHAFPSELWLVTELCEAGSLLDIMRSRRAPLAEPQIAAALKAALLALRYLHEECLMLHRDIKVRRLPPDSRGSPDTHAHTRHCPALPSFNLFQPLPTIRRATYSSQPAASSGLLTSALRCNSARRCPGAQPPSARPTGWLPR